MWRPVGRSVTESAGPNSGPDLSGPFKIYYETIILFRYISIQRSFYHSSFLLYLKYVHAVKEHGDPGFCFRSPFVVW